MDGASLRAVGEGRIGLVDPDEGDPHGVVGVAVVVRVDGAVEPASSWSLRV